MDASARHDQRPDDPSTDEESNATVSPPPPPPTVATSVEQKKLHRNARDRSRSQLKKSAMETMRLQVAQLEATKQRLEQQFPSLTSAREETVASNVAGWVTPTEGDPPHPARLRAAQAQHLRVLQQIEVLRRDNRAMALEVLQRDLFRSAVQNLVDARANDVASSADSEPPLVVPATLSPPMPATDAVECAQRIARQLFAARRECDARIKQRLSGARVFGWSDFRLRTDASVQFTIQKTLSNQCASVLAMRTWDVFADITQLRRLLPAGVQCELRTVQRVGDDAIVFDRVTTSRGFDQLRFTALRTTYMLVRARDDRGNWSIGMKTVDLPAFRAALAPHESWCDIFYWFHFEDVAGDDPVGINGTAVVFGGALSYFTESIARQWLAELVFLAVRWESKIVAPVLLKD